MGSPLAPDIVVDDIQKDPIERSVRAFSQFQDAADHLRSTSTSTILVDQAALSETLGRAISGACTQQSLFSACQNADRGLYTSLSIHPNARNHVSTIVKHAELANCDISRFRSIAVTDDPASSYVLLWNAPKPLGKMYASDISADTLSPDAGLLIINVQDADDVATRRAICDELRPMLAGRHGETQNGWEGAQP